MKRLLQGLSQLLRAAAGRQRLAAAPSAREPEWTEGEARQMAQFLASDFGKRLWGRFRAIELDNYQRAGADCMHTTHSAGRARGWTDARVWLESLAGAHSASAAHDSISREAGGAASPAGQGYPAEPDTLQPDGEAELRERFSP